VKAQSSLHTIAGFDHLFHKWGRPFKLTTELYFKYLWNVIPYDIDNVRLRYYADNNATAYATGIDIRLSGEFIPGDESWFSLGLLSTKEDIAGDGLGYIPRPTDQLVNFNIFFQDHLPNNPSFKIHLNFHYASGLPFSPPGSDRFRNSFRGEAYHRADVGFSKMIFFNKERDNAFGLKSLWLGAEVLNLTGSQNVITYYWVRSVTDVQYAIPNSLSARFLNLRVTASF
jgi:hypothetical protein